MICAGIPRSGSTWLYNAARLLLQIASGPEQVHGAWIDQYEPANPARWHVVKIHNPDEALAWRGKCILTSRRDLRDIAASAWKRGWISDGPSMLALLESVVAQHAWWRERCAFEMIYERMRVDRVAELRSIAGALGVAVDASSSLKVLQQIDALGHDDASEDAFNASNLLHKQHIMDGRVGYHAQILPAELLALINNRHGEWLRANGYRL